MRGVGMALQQVAYIKFAKWELRQGQPALARAVFERAVAELGDVRDSPVVEYRLARPPSRHCLPCWCGGACAQHEKDEELYIQFAKFEQRCKEY